MELFLQGGAFLLAVLFVVLNGCTQFYYARSIGFRLKPTAFAYFAGAAGNLLAGSVVPISGQAETLALSGLIRNRNERTAALLIAAFTGVVIGLWGKLSAIVDFAGPGVISGMMAGVGFILSEVAINQCRQEKRTGIISVIAALAAWGLTHDVIGTIAVSVFVSAFDFCVLQKRRVDMEAAPEEGEGPAAGKGFWRDFRLVKPALNLNALLGGFSFICLNIGSNISFGNITASFAQTAPKLNALMVINSLADVPSVIFGGMPVEAIISGTAAAPWPVAAGILMMVLCGLILLTGLVEKIGRYIPSHSIAGFLLVIGVFLTIIPNLASAAAGKDHLMEGIVAMSATVLTKNAFIGLALGVLARFGGGLFGLL